MLAAQPVFAQDPTGMSLDDLIPEEAVENPEEWASDPEAEISPETDETPLQPDTPMTEMPSLTVEWPDDLDLPPLERLEPDVDVRFADTDLPPLPELPDATLVKVGSDLVLAFPNDTQNFSVREEFIGRFRSLSTVADLSNGEENIAQLAARARADQELLDEMLRVYGYYDAQVIRTVGGLRPGQDTADTDPVVRFDIIPGPRYRFGAIDLGNLDAAPDYPMLRSVFEIETGDPVSSDKIVEEQLDLDMALGENGYPFAEIGEADLLIDHSETRGDLTLPVEPKGKYRFGEVVSSDPDFLSGRHLASIARFEAGDIFQRSLELDLRRAITATGLVSSVSVTPREVQPPSGAEPGVVALDVAMTKAPLRTIAGAVGYGSEEGFRIAASWEHRNFFPPEGSLKFRGIAGTREQLAGITFRKNNFGGRDKILTLDAYASTIDSDAFDARTAAFVATYERTSNLLFQKPLSWSAGFEAIATSERPAAVNGVVQPRQTFFVGALPVSALLDSTDDLLNPKEGFRIGGRLSPEISRSNGTESFYLRGQFDASYYQSVTDKVVVAGRTRFASIPGTDLANIAPSRRLYAGGGSSVRGYGFQEIGPRDVLGEPSGGRSLVEFSLEARVQTGFMDGAVSVVPFVDAGSVGRGTTPDFDEIKFGAGLGIRYDTGFGPIRVDVGVPLNPGPNDNPVAVYVSLGQAF
ncbi:BamA/TamA family outer membrane protein [Altererythrobacter aquaemixtae]|uniref:BamA/TamA family outer membrane protein n=2 Tax=Pontixanthobacter aquaemixtae TaxID=1958940 RepID=A0A844ZNU7_9SPHN|nr:BamA/TamA family outer membrane protein [Pontixanthobacter aquaemixtae]